MGDWLVKAIENKNVLTLHKAYFQLRKPLGGGSMSWPASISGKQTFGGSASISSSDKTGSTSTAKEFKRLVKAICKADEDQSHMP